MASYALRTREVPLEDGWDVVVAGGGPAGCAAAAAAAREGARTVLLEAAGALGGMGTLGLVPWFCGYGDGEKAVARGIAERVRRETTRATGEHGDHLSPTIHPEALKRTYDRLAADHGVTVRFHTQVCGVECAEDGAVDALLAGGKAGLRAWRAKVFVDATGDGDVAAWAGAPFEKGDAQGRLQPATHCFALANVEDPVDCWMRQDPRPGERPSLHFFDPESPVHAAVASERYPLIVDHHSCARQLAPGLYGFNFGHLFGVDSTDPESLSDALARGREQAAQYRDALAEFHPSFREAFLVATGALLGVRESRRIEGDYVLVLDDYLARRSFDDEIGRNAYVVDIHHEKEEVDRLMEGARSPQERLQRILKDSKQLGRGRATASRTGASRRGVCATC